MEEDFLWRAHKFRDKPFTASLSKLHHRSVFKDKGPEELSLAGSGKFITTAEDITRRTFNLFYTKPSKYPLPIWQ